MLIATRLMTPTDMDRSNDKDVVMKPGAIIPAYQTNLSHVVGSLFYQKLLVSLPNPSEVLLTLYKWLTG